jgi:hypothetical protein
MSLLWMVQQLGVRMGRLEDDCEKKDQMRKTLHNQVPSPHIPSSHSPPPPHSDSIITPTSPPTTFQRPLPR